MNTLTHPRQNSTSGKLRQFPLVVAVVAYFIFFTLCNIVREEIEGNAWMLMLDLGGASLCFILWWRMDWQGNPLLSFGPALLLSGGINRVLYTLDVLLNGEHFNDWWPVASADQGWSLLRGEAATMVAIFLLAWSWCRVTNKNRIHQDVSGGSIRGYWIMYALPLFPLLLLRNFVGIDASAGSIMIVLSSAGLVSIMVLSSATGKKTSLKSVFFSAVLSVPYVFIALGTGMKEELIVSILPFLMSYWAYYRNLYARISIILILTIFISIVTSYVGYYRERVWAAKIDLPTWQVVQEFISLSDADREKQGAGGITFLTRNNATYEHGIAIDVGDVYGIRPKDIFGPLLYIFIPRFLWHDKPSVMPGLEYASILYGDQYSSTSTTSIAAGFSPALYMGGGYFAVLLLSPVLGWMVATLQRLATKIGNAYTGKILNWSFFIFALRLDEQWPVYAFSSPMISCAYILIFSMAIEILTTGKLRNKANQSGRLWLG